MSRTRPQVLQQVDLDLTETRHVADRKLGERLGILGLAGLRSIVGGGVLDLLFIRGRFVLRLLLLRQCRADAETGENRLHVAPYLAGL